MKAPLNSPFEFWWKHVPKKVGKIQARKAYQRAVRIISVEDSDADPHAILLEAIKVYSTSKTVREGFVTNPATWLNAGRWLDEYETPAEKKASVSKMDDTTRAEMERARKIRSARQVKAEWSCPTCGDSELVFRGKVSGKWQCVQRECYERANDGDL